MVSQVDWGGGRGIAVAVCAPGTDKREREREKGVLEEQSHHQVGDKDRSEQETEICNLKGRRGKERGGKEVRRQARKASLYWPDTQAVIYSYPLFFPFVCGHVVYNIREPRLEGRGMQRKNRRGSYRTLHRAQTHITNQQTLYFSCRLPSNCIEHVRGCIGSVLPHTFSLRRHHYCPCVFYLHMSPCKKLLWLCAAFGSLGDG